MSRDFQEEYIESLNGHISFLREHISFLEQQLAAKDTQINALNMAIDRERQLIHSDILNIRKLSDLILAETRAAQEPHPQKQRQQFQQTPKKRTLSERIRDFFR